MGNVNAVPVVSQVKSLGQVANGNSEGARITQEDFTKLCPVISQTRSLVHSMSGEHDKALEIQQEFGKNLNIAIESVPVLGHIKGGVHYALGDDVEATSAIKRATKPIGIVVGGAAGMVLGGITGAREGAELGIQAIDTPTPTPQEHPSNYPDEIE